MESLLKHTPEEMRKFLGLIILMGQVRKKNIRDYWSTDPYNFHTHFSSHYE